MKSLILISGLFLGVFVVNAQVSYFDNSKEERSVNELRGKAFRQRIIDNHITAQKTYYYKVGNADSTKGYLITEVMYDSKGHITEFKLYRKNGSIKEHDQYKWNKDGKNIEFTQLRPNGTMIYKETTAFDSSGNVTDERFFWKRPDNMTWHGVSTYDNSQNLTELKYYTSNDKKLFSRYVYSYYPDGSKKQTVEYNRKNEVKHTWNYDCNPVGNLEIKSLKDSSTICIRYETDKDGNRIKIKEQNVKQKKIVRIITKYDSRDNEIFSAQYDSKGRVRQQYERAFDEKNNIIETRIYKKGGVLKQKNIYHYDTSGNITEEIAYKNAPVPDHVTKFSYIIQF